MNENLELDRLAKENDNFKKIIQTQQNTINRMIDYFILGEKKLDCKSSFFRVTML
ncbi:MAG: adenylate kinase [Roseburia hominis]